MQEYILPKTLVTKPKGNWLENSVNNHGAAYKVGETSCLSK